LLDWIGKELGVQTFVDPASHRSQLSFDRLPRGVVKFPAHIVEAVGQERARFSPEIFTAEYARKSLEQQTLSWYYQGLPVAYKALPDGIEVLGVGWEEAAKYWPASPDPDVRVVQP
jgi:hypothetical protein